MDESLYSRQLYVLGPDALRSMQQSVVLLDGLGELGWEVAKNIILAGIKKLVILENNNSNSSSLTLQELNPYVELEFVYNIELEELLTKKIYNLVITTNNYSYDKLVAINKLAFSTNTKFISCYTNCFKGGIFCDFGLNFLVKDQDGEEPQQGLLTEYNNETNIYTTAKKHGLYTGDILTINSIDYTVTNKGLNLFTIQPDNNNLVNNYYIQQKQPLTINFKRVDEIDQLKQEYPTSFNNETYPPIVSVIGSIASQEIMKGLSGKFTPINQWFTFEDNLLETHIDTINSVEFKNRVKETSIFLVGSGAIGCEHLKHYAKMGVGNVIITDMDTIEKSNLNRQFLFRSTDIGLYKSEVAKRETLKMNPNMNIVSLKEQVGLTTINLFNEQFFSKLTCVTNALDNVQARLFVDSLCVSNNKPLFESGTLGTKGNVQVVLPKLTESYGSSSDPTEESVPVCTLKSFPYQIEHTIQWAMEQFDLLFNKIPFNYNRYKDLTLDSSLSLSETEITEIKEYLEKAAMFISNYDTYIDELYNTLFIKPILELQEKHPQDSITENGSLFWSGTKRYPIITNISDRYKADFINYTKLIYNNKLDVVTFEKDDPTNYHIDFINCVSNIRALIYGIQIVDKSKTKQIAGKIIPAIATTTSLVSGLVCLELYKYLLGCNKVTDYRNYFLNLAIPYVMWSDPIECQKNSLGLTLWDNLSFTDKNVTILDIIDKFSELYKLKVETIMAGTILLYSSWFTNKDSIKKTVLDTYKQVSKTDLESSIQNPLLLTVTIDNCLSDSESESGSGSGEEKEEDTPLVKIYF